MKPQGHDSMGAERNCDDQVALQFSGVFGIEGVREILQVRTGMGAGRKDTNCTDLRIHAFPSPPSPPLPSPPLPPYLHLSLTLSLSPFLSVNGMLIGPHSRPTEVVPIPDK